MAEGPDSSTENRELLLTANPLRGTHRSHAHDYAGTSRQFRNRRYTSWTFSVYLAFQRMLPRLRTVLLPATELAGRRTV
jgi:hypothetical protein